MRSGKGKIIRNHLFYVKWMAQPTRAKLDRRARRSNPEPYVSGRTVMVVLAVAA